MSPHDHTCVFLDFSEGLWFCGHESVPRWLAGGVRRSRRISLRGDFSSIVQRLMAVCIGVHAWFLMERA